MLLCDKLLTSPNVDFKFIDSLAMIVKDAYPSNSFIVKDWAVNDAPIKKEKLVEIFNVNLDGNPRLMKVNSSELYTLYKLYSAIEKPFWRDLYKFRSPGQSNGFRTLDWFCRHPNFHFIKDLVEAEYYQKDNNQKISSWHRPSIIDIVASPSSAFAQALLKADSQPHQEQVALIRNMCTTHYCDKEKYLFETKNRGVVFWDEYLKYVKDSLPSPTHKEIIASVLDDSLSKLESMMKPNSKHDERITTLRARRLDLVTTTAIMNDVRYDGVSLNLNEESSQEEVASWVNDKLPSIKTRYIVQLWKDGAISHSLLNKIIRSIFETNSPAGLRMLHKFNEAFDLPLEIKRAIHWEIWTCKDIRTEFKFQCSDLLEITQGEIYSWKKEDAFNAYSKIHDEPGAIQIIMECHALDAEDLLFMLEELSSRYEELKLGVSEPSKGDRSIRAIMTNILEKLASEFAYNSNHNNTITSAQLACFLKNGMAIEQITPFDLHQMNPKLLVDAIEFGGREINDLIGSNVQIQETIVAISLSQRLSSLEVNDTKSMRQAL